MTEEKGGDRIENGLEILKSYTLEDIGYWQAQEVNAGKKSLFSLDLVWKYHSLSSGN